MRNSQSSVVALVSSLLITSLLVMEQSDGAEPARPKHPVLRHDETPVEQTRRKAAAAETRKYSEAELAAFVPRQTPFITCDCPSCGAQTYTRGPDKVLWKFEFPDRLTCRSCQTSYPNERFPNNKSRQLLNTRGEAIEVASFANAAGREFDLDATITTWRNAWLVEHIEALARDYHETKDEADARRVAVVLAEYAEHFPHYLVKDFLTAIDKEPGTRGMQRSRYEYVSTGGPWIVKGRPRGKRPEEPAASTQATNLPYGWTQSRWGWGRWCNEVPLELLNAYDLIHDSDVFEKLSTERGRDVRKQIEEGLFREAAEYELTYPFYYHVHNNAGSQVAAIVRTGMVLNEPKYIAFGDRWGRGVLEQYAFSREGAFGESPGYFYVFLATQADNFNALQEAAECFAGSGATSAGMAENAKKSIAFLKKSQAAIESVRFPNGSSLPISDNRHDEFVDPTYRPGVRSETLTTSTNLLLPGYGHALLGAGSGDRQVQAHLHFSPFKQVIHTHPDGLSLMLWAFGSEFFTDIGYNRTKYRSWASTTLSHNTVVVDRAKQDGTETKGKLRAYAADPRGWSFVQVEDADCYGPPVTRYRRSLLLNTLDLDAPYLVDVFEVHGGRTHDYALHGPTVFESTATTELPLVPLPGERPLLTPDEAAAYVPDEHPYGRFTHVRSARTADDFSLTFRLVEPYRLPEFTPNSRYPAGSSFHYAVDPQHYADRGELGVRSHFIGSGDASTGEREVLLGETPSLLRGGLMGGPLTDKLRRPSLLIRRQGTADSKTADLKSVFVAVHEPHYKQPKIKSVRRLPTAESTDSVVALQIETAGRTDTVLLAIDGDRVTTTGPNGATLVGRLAVATKDAAGKSQGYLLGGTAFRLGDFALQSDVAAYAGTIDGVTSVWTGDATNTFATTATLPDGNELHGRWLIVHHDDEPAGEGFQIDRIERRSDRTIIHLADDPGLKKNGDSTEEIFFPRRRWTSASRFTLQTQKADGPATP